MDYIQTNLADNEQIISEIKHSKWAVLSIIFWGMVITAIGIGISYAIKVVTYFLQNNGMPQEIANVLGIVQTVIFILAWLIGFLCIISGIIELKNTRLVVTNKRLLGSIGFISKHNIDIMLSKIDTVNSTNSVLGAIFHYGSIEVISAGSAKLVEGVDKNMSFDGIENTVEFKKAVLEAIDKVKEEERRAQAEEQAKALKEAMNNNG